MSEDPAGDLLGIIFVYSTNEKEIPSLMFLSPLIA